MKKLLLFLMVAFSLQAQVSTQKVVNTATIRDSNSPLIFNGAARFNSTLQFTNGAGLGKVALSDASGFFSWNVATFGDAFLASNNVWTATNTFNKLVIVSTNGIRIGTNSYLFNDAGFSLIVREGNSQILQLVTNGELSVVNPNFSGSAITLRPRFGPSGFFATNPVITFSGNSTSGNLTFGANSFVANAPAFYFDTQVVVSNNITSLAFIDILGGTPQLTFQPTRTPGGMFILFSDDVNTGAGHSVLGMRTNSTAFTYRSGATTLNNGAEEFRIDVGQVTVSNNFYVGGTFLYPKGLNFTLTNNGVGSTNFTVFGNGVVTNFVHIP